MAHWAAEKYPQLRCSINFYWLFHKISSSAHKKASTLVLIWAELSGTKSKRTVCLAVSTQCFAQGATSKSYKNFNACIFLYYVFVNNEIRPPVLCLTCLQLFQASIFLKIWMIFLHRSPLFFIVSKCFVLIDSAFVYARIWLPFCWWFYHFFHGDCKSDTCSSLFSSLHCLEVWLDFWFFQKNLTF